jgi:hypothetical protein
MELTIIMFVSTFELLLNVTQLPREVQGVPPGNLEIFRPISREVIQGYFLTISNLEKKALVLQLIFTVVSSTNEDKFDNAVVSSFFDAEGSNQILTFNALTPETRSLILTLPSQETGLLVVQPNPFLLLKNLDESEIEIRGYVEIKQLQSCGEGSAVAKILLTPEQRGTFYNLQIPTLPDGSFDRKADLKLSERQQLDQITYSLPTGTGGCLFELG